MGRILDNAERRRSGDGSTVQNDLGNTAESNLFEQRGFPRAVFDAIPHPLLVVDSELQVRLVNQHMRHQFSGAGEAPIRHTTGEVLRCRNALDNPESNCGQLGRCGSCQIRLPAKDALSGTMIHRRRCEFEYVDGDRPRHVNLLVSATPFEHQGSRLAVVILEDVTELETLRHRRDSVRSFAGIVGSSSRMHEIFDTIRDVAGLDVPVLIQGESGTGKELVARAIHSQGKRAHERFVPVNCGAIPEGLLESELFGHVKGAFTGAVRTHKGRFELAHRGTIFLDEIADLSQPMQVKLLRVLQEGTFEPVGGERSVAVDVRVVSASNRDLARELAAGRFREDLYYRLCVVPITVPPLRERLVDLPLIAEHLLAEEGVPSAGKQLTLSSAALVILLQHHWPGNVRELQNALHYAAIKCKGRQLMPEHLPPELRARAQLDIARASDRPRLTVARVGEALEQTDGNRTEAAKALGVSRATLYRFLDRCSDLDTDGASAPGLPNRGGS